MSLKICCEIKIYLFTTQFQGLSTLIKNPFENTVGKGKNAGNQHSLLFLQCFSSLSKTNFNISASFIMSSATQFQGLSTLIKNPFENTVGKGKNAGNQHSLLFLQCFI